MSKNLTRTLQGKTLDMEELRLRNESVIPVGNLPKSVSKLSKAVNNSVATGTRKLSKDDSRRISSHWVQDAPVMPSLRVAREVALRFIDRDPDDGAAITEDYNMVKDTSKKQKTESAISKPDEVAATVTDEELEQAIKKSAARPRSLAEALGRSRTITQTPLKTPREEARSKTGVKKL